jgi:hypothetical protein
LVNIGAKSLPKARLTCIFINKPGPDHEFVGQTAFLSEIKRSEQSRAINGILIAGRGCLMQFSFSREVEYDR